jgi:hypothetical protein
MDSSPNEIATLKFQLDHVAHMAPRMNADYIQVQLFKQHLADLLAENHRIVKEQLARMVADQKAEDSTEARIYRQRPNPHDD